MFPAIPLLKRALCGTDHTVVPRHTRLLPRCLQEVNGSVSWKTNVAIKQPWVKVEGWVLPEMPPLITDILVSMDDK